KMVQALMGGLAQRRLDKEQTGLESKIQTERGGLVQALLNSPGSTQYQDVVTPGGTRQVSLPPSPALSTALDSGDPVLGQLASSLISGSSEQAKEQRAEAAKMREIQMAHELNRPLNEAQIGHLGAQSAALSQPEFHFFEGGPGQPYGTMNTRTGELNLKGITRASP